MIIQCPRCGFSQPEDQYCAQCGVNMQSFQRKEKPFVKKILENLAAQVLVLVIFAGFIGTYMIQSGSSPQWAQKLTKSQGVSKSTKPIPTQQPAHENLSSSSSSVTIENLKDLTNKEITVETKPSNLIAAAPPAAKLVTETGGGTAPTSKTADMKDSNSDISGVLFRLTYAEVSTETLAKWVAESSRLGLFQHLQNYSAGILPDFKKYNNPITQFLKTAEKKIPPGQSETDLSGTMSDDGNQMIGLSVSYDVKSMDANSVHGSILVTRSSRQSRENFPAEFDLPKGAVFFMIDTLTHQNFRTEKTHLTMAPFQILKSIDFSANKSKFIIILEPELK